VLIWCRLTQVDLEEVLIWCRLTRVDLEEGLIWFRLTRVDLEEGLLNEFVCCCYMNSTHTMHGVSDFVCWLVVGWSRRYIVEKQLDELLLGTGAGLHQSHSVLKGGRGRITQE